MRQLYMKYSGNRPPTQRNDSPQAGASPQRPKNKHTPRTIKLENVELETWNSGFYGTMLRVAGASPQLTKRKHTPRPIKLENVELDTWNSVFYGARVPYSSWPEAGAAPQLTKRKYTPRLVN
ncbi:hypothetical protein TcasGA2_TC016107 [Tribolium castaneum]|uniref:Uncharacterized protein n=1 Tax=Tribolium castaneum TaxID=7070 RepID=D7ELH1_TRICA|nr:hypothetical protein TcasGA2_TC016107 [Tribolium castaneum]